MTKVYVEGYSPEYCDMFERHGFTITNNIDKAEMVCFVGGADVNPALYQEENTASDISSAHDLMSLGIYTRVAHKDIPLVGICRGGQFLNVMMGGSMKQHLHGHPLGTHMLYGPDGPVKVRSHHHQGMVSNSELEPIVYHAEDGNEEIVMYVKEKVFCFQPHPEYMPTDSDTEKLFFELLKDCYLD